ncbi:LysR family transcriptional regulator [Pseudonocardia alni]|uniref:LysR family transcriptional regulator n=1 Tax=Pseudonocardia alni TaxID=33907 RepID=UPI003316C38D
MDLRHLHVLAVVDQERSVTRAAQRLHTSQSALSQLLRRIEQELGFSVFDRSTTPLQPTPAGARFLPRALEVEATYVQAVESARGSARSARPRIAATPRLAGLVFPVLLAEAGAHRPDLRLQLIEASSSELRTLVVRDIAQLAILSAPSASEGIVFEPVLSGGFVAAVRAGSGGAGRQDVCEAGDLHGCDLLLPKAGGVRTHLDPFLAGLQNVSVALESGSTATLLGVAEIGLGVALVPELVITPADRARHPGLEFRPVVEGPPELQIGLARRAGLTPTPHQRDIDDLARRALRLCFPQAAPAETVDVQRLRPEGRPPAPGCR